MEHIQNDVALEASTDERASALQPPTDWHDAFGPECDLTHPHLPADFALNLSRDGADPSLTSNDPLDTWPHNPDDWNNRLNTSHGPALAPHTNGRAPRHDGFTAEAENLFLRTLADTGVVSDACRATGLSRQAAYARRHSAAGRAFALAWDAALLLARGALADDVMSRARHGVIERVYRDGVLVAERHKYDNRLTMAVLARLDRLAEGQGEGAPVSRAIAQEFDQFLALLPDGLDAAERFVTARFPGTDTKGAPRMVKEPISIHGDAPASGSEAALLARLSHYTERGVGLPAEIAIDDLDPEDMTAWTEDQWDRAEASGFLGMLTAYEWPDEARDDAADGTAGMCQIRQQYLIYHPSEPVAADEPEDDFCGCYVWESDDGEWLTDFPPPPGFDGYEEGQPGSHGYKRSLSPEEAAIVEAHEAHAKADRLAEREAARRRYFELVEAQAS